MKLPLFFTLLGLIVFTPGFAAKSKGQINEFRPGSATAAIPVDDSSYESLFIAAYQSEAPGGAIYKTTEALVEFRGLDLMDLVHQPYRRTEGEEFFARQQAAHTVHRIAEYFFRAGHIDEATAFLKRMLPPQDETEGMLCAGYVSESLLEQKRFDLAWQIANSGPLNERAGKIGRYIERTIAKTYYDKTPSNHGLVPLLPPYVPNEADKEIYRAEANRALEYLQNSPEPADDRQREMVANRIIPQALAVLGRCDEAYALVENDRDRVELLRSILRERRENGTQEEVDQWFKKIRTFYDNGKVSGGIDWAPATTFIWYCLDAGKYLDAMDAIESHGGRKSARSIGDPGGYFNRIPKLNVETDFRYNSKELIDRLIKYHDTVDENDRWLQRDEHQFRPHIVKAQLNLGLLDDALESLRKTTGSLEALESLGDIVFYALKNKTPEEASRIEAEAITLFKNIEEVKKREMGDYYLVDYYAQMAVRLMKDGEAEKGVLYLKTALDWAEKEQVRQNREARRAFRTNSQIERVCETLVAGGYLDKAAEIAEQHEDRYIMPNLHLRIAENRASAEEMDKAKKSIRKSLEQISQITRFAHPYDYTSYSRMAMCAVKFEDKELFYEILNAGMKAYETRVIYENSYTTSEALGVFVRQLAAYGDKDHPLFVQAEKTADGFKEMNKKADLYFSLGVGQAILGDHLNARRLLKKGIEARQKDEFKSLASFCAAIIEAKFYESQTINK